MLEIFRAVCQGKSEPYAKLCELFDEQTDDGRDMGRFSGLLEAAISAIAAQSDKKNLGNLFTGRGAKLIDETKLPKSASDFDLVTWLVILAGEGGSAWMSNLGRAGVPEPPRSRRSHRQPVKRAGFRAILCPRLRKPKDRQPRSERTPPSFLARFFDPANGTLAEQDSDAKTDKWRQVDFLFQLTNDEIPALAQGNRDLSHGQQELPNLDHQYHSSFLAIELSGEDWSRGALAGITREINRLFPMPALILFRYAGLASLAVIDRRPNKKDGSRDVIEKRISIVKDIDLAKPHPAHVYILCDIALSEVKVRGRGAPANFRDLYDGWIEALSVQTLNKKFYAQLANWFFWSVKQVTFPAASLETDDEKREEQNQIAVIRLLTRLIFVWFIKEKGLVPEALFAPDQLRLLLVEDPTAHPDSGTYYKAVLQNLFFATLNTEMSGDRKVAHARRPGGGLDGQYLIHTRLSLQGRFPRS